MPEDLVARDYALQRLLYALAVLREGALAVEVVHWFLERPHEPALARYTLAERAALEEQLARASERRCGRPVRGQPGASPGPVPRPAPAAAACARGAKRRRCARSPKPPENPGPAAN